MADCYNASYSRQVVFYVVSVCLNLTAGRRVQFAPTSVLLPDIAASMAPPSPKAHDRRLLDPGMMSSVDDNVGHGKDENLFSDLQGRLRQASAKANEDKKHLAAHQKKLEGIFNSKAGVKKRDLSAELLSHPVISWNNLLHFAQRHRDDPQANYDENQIEQLVDQARSRLDDTDEFGMTIVDYAVRSDNKLLLEILVKKHLNTSVNLSSLTNKDQNGDTPLHKAAALGNRGAVSALKSLRYLENHQRKTPRHIAEEKLAEAKSKFNMASEMSEPAPRITGKLREETVFETKLNLASLMKDELQADFETRLAIVMLLQSYSEKEADKEVQVAVQTVAKPNYVPKSTA